MEITDELVGTPVMGKGELVMEQSGPLVTSLITELGLGDLESLINSDMDESNSTIPLIPQISLMGDKVNTICMGAPGQK